MRDQNVIYQYKKDAAVVKDFVFELSPANQSIFVERMKNFTNEIYAPRRTVAHAGCPVQDSQRNNSNEVLESPLDLSLPKTSNTQPVDNSETSSASNVALQNNINKENLEPPIERSLLKAVLSQPSAFISSQPLAILSSIENIKVPDNIKAVGRPKGSSLTVIGTKRRNESTKSSVSKRIVEDGSA